VPSYRLVFPPPPGVSATNSETAQIDSGDELYVVGSRIEWEGKVWVVTQAPLDQPMLGDTADLLVWPADE